jgi:y4mF family transcriptional regulator
MKHSIRSPEDLALVIRAVRKSTRMRQDDLAAVVGVSQQFAVDVERGKPTVQFGRVLRLLEELGVSLNVDIPDEASRKLEELRNKPAGALRVRRPRRDAPSATPSASGATGPQPLGDIDLTEGSR